MNELKKEAGVASAAGKMIAAKVLSGAAKRALSGGGGAAPAPVQAQQQAPAQPKKKGLIRRGIGLAGKAGKEVAGLGIGTAALIAERQKKNMPKTAKLELNNEAFQQGGYGEPKKETAAQKARRVLSSPKAKKMLGGAAGLGALGVGIGAAKGMLSGEGALEGAASAAEKAKSVGLAPPMDFSAEEVDAWNAKADAAKGAKGAISKAVGAKPGLGGGYSSIEGASMPAPSGGGASKAISKAVGGKPGLGGGYSSIEGASMPAPSGGEASKAISKAVGGKPGLGGGYSSIEGASMPAPSAPAKTPLGAHPRLGSVPLKGGPASLRPGGSAGMGLLRQGR